MRNLWVKGFFFLALLGLGLQIQPVSAQESEDVITCDHDRGKSTDNFFGYARLFTTPVFVCDCSAVSLLAEVGPKNYRIGGTYGFFACDQHRFKVGVEYLQQKFHYKYITGKTSKWQRQWAVGAKYQYLFNDCCDPCDPCCCNWLSGIQLSTAFSNCNSHHLKTLICDDPPFIARNLSNSWFVDGEVGVILTPWECGSIIVGLSYDYVRYGKNVRDNEALIHEHGHKIVQGVGGSIEFDQKFCGCYGLHILAQFKRPYNYFEALLSWTKRTACGDLIVGVFGAHTWGKCNLNSSSAAGVELGFAFGIDGCCNIVWCDPCSDPCDCCNPCIYSELSDWVSSPAVYMPEVLSIANEGRNESA